MHIQDTKQPTCKRYLRWLIVQFATILILLVIITAILGEIATGPAPTAVEVLVPDFPIRNVSIDTDDDHVVHGWLIEGRPGYGVVLLVHSMRSNRLEMLGRARFLGKNGYSVLMIDLQAHGETPGNRITFGARESNDVAAAIAYLRGQFPGERIGAIGVTLGAAAILLAEPPLRLDAVILESVHATFTQAVENRLRLHLGEASAYLKFLLLPYFALLLDLPINELNPIDRIGKLHAPLLLITGTKDRHTTQSEVAQLFAAASPPKELWVVDGAGHYNMHTYAGKTYEDRIDEFLSSHLWK